MNPPNIISDVSESYFVNPPPGSNLHGLLADEKNKINYELNSGAHREMKEMWETLSEPHEQYGFSKSINAFYAKLCVTHFHDRGGFTTLPFYLTFSSAQGVQKVHDPVYKKQWQDLEFQMEFQFKKYLLHLTYNHRLADGRMLEFVFDEKQLRQKEHNAQVYHFIKSYRLSQRLENNLPCTNDTPGKRMKI